MRANIFIKWGLLLGVSIALGTQILTWLGLGLTNWFVLLTYALVVAFVILGLKDLKNQEKTKLNFINAALTMVGIIVISRLIFQTYMYIYIHYIDPSWVDTVSDIWTMSLQESNIAADIIEQQIDSFRKSYETLPMFTSSLIFFAIPQIVLGLAISTVYLFVNKK